MELLVSMGEGKNIRSIRIEFLVIPCKHIYNFILGRPFTTTLDAIASPVPLKLKYHNLNGELDVLHADLEVAKKIHNALQEDQWENIPMEINMISLIRQLQISDIHTP